MVDITSYIFNPVATSTVVALIASVLVVTALIQKKAAIGKVLAQWRARIFTRTGFFWIVNLVFMGVSVLHAGAFFGIAGKDNLAHDLGFAVSFFLDLVTILLMQAMLEARYRGEVQRAHQFLVFIVICCGTSTFANLAISLNDFDPNVMLHNAPDWVKVATPYILASFPLFVIMMSIAAEMIINVRPLETLDEQEYESAEKKRLKILEIRNTYLQKQVDEELRTLSIRAQMRMQRQLRKGNLPSSFRWPWEKPANVEELTAIVAAQFKARYEPQWQELQRRLEEMNAHLAANNWQEIATQWQEEAVILADNNRQEIATQWQEEAVILADQNRQEWQDQTAILADNHRQQIATQWQEEAANLSDENRQEWQDQTDILAHEHRDKSVSQTGTVDAKKLAQKPAQKMPKNRHENRRQLALNPASPTAIRDEKIRHYAAKHPSITHAKLAAKFDCSERTVARALSVKNTNVVADNDQRQTVAQGQEETALLYESADENRQEWRDQAAKMSDQTNKSGNTDPTIMGQEQTTDELEAVPHESAFNVEEYAVMA